MKNYDEGKILLLDTEKNVTLSYKSILSEEGYFVDIARNQAEALKKITCDNVAVLVTELYIKGTDTLELIEKIKNDFPYIYIIMTTGNPLSQEIYAKIFDIGIDDCFAKPFSVSALLANIKKGFFRINGIRTRIKLEEKLEKINQYLSSDKTFNYEEQIICNAIYFNKRLHEEILRAKRYNHPFSLILLNIKSLNKNNNHINSSMQKKSMDDGLSEIIIKNTRKADIITNYNGTYALILIETSQNGTEVFRNRLLKVMASISQKEPHIQEVMESLNISYFTFPDQSNLIEEWIDKLDTRNQL